MSSSGSGESSDVSAGETEYRSRSGEAGRVSKGLIVSAIVDKVKWITGAGRETRCVNDGSDHDGNHVIITIGTGDQTGKRL